MLVSVLMVLALAPAPTAIVDSVSGDADLKPLQLLAPGTVVDLPGGARVRLAYFASCVHETVRGGRLRVGVTASLAADAVVERVTADCAPPQYGPAQAGVPGALVLRTGGAAVDVAPVRRVRTRSPVLLTSPGAQLTLTRIGPGNRQLFVPADDGRADLAVLGIELEDDAVYRACNGRRCLRIWVDPGRHHDAGPVLERVVRVP